MKDEEMAEKYVKSVIDVNAFDWKIVREICLAFLAGLKAGRPQWHKVADGDLPKEQKEYWCKVYYFESEETFNAFLWFDTNTKDFKFLEEIESSVESTFNVKEWCEVPEYIEE